MFKAHGQNADCSGKRGDKKGKKELKT